MAANFAKIVLPIILFLAGCAKKHEPEPNPLNGEVYLHSVFEMNTEEPVLNSHAGDELRSVLQPIPSTFQIIKHNILTVGAPSGASEQQYAMYPRIKKMANGRFIMFYHSGTYGSRIWYTTSKDFLSWDAPKMLYEPYSVTIIDVSGKSVQDFRRFVNPDAVVLPNGDILMVCSYRAGSYYGDGIDCGLSFRRSTNNGQTWSQPREVPVGPNWEPYLLALPDGRIQCYFTDATPQTRNSGTSIIVSEDKGQTWSGKKRVSRQYKYDYKTIDPAKIQYNGEKIYTDQMPCFRILNDGKTLLGFLEARIENPVPNDCSKDTYSSHCEMSVVYNNGLEWEALGETKAGPSRRLTNVMKRGAAGYVATFPSGEVLLSCNSGNLYRIRMCNAAATKFYGSNSWDNMSNWFTPFEGLGFWGSMEVCGSNLLAMGMHSQEEGMQLGMAYLNQRLDAKDAEVVLDGKLEEWDTNKALYIGAKTGEEVLIRASHDGEALYLALDCKDPDRTSLQTLILQSDNSAPLVIKLNANGLISSGKDGVEVKTKPAAASDGTAGYVAEVKIPLSLTGATKGAKINIYAMMEKNNSRTAFNFADGSDPSTWQLLKIM